jgi:hypothetical protein
MKGFFMEQINTIELSDPDIFPDESLLKNILGESYDRYLELLDCFVANEMNHEWRYYRDGKAWLCKVQKKKRTIIWMSAWRGFMKATVYIPEKAIEGIYKLAISEDTKQRIRETKNVGKSKPCIFEVKSKKAINELSQIIKYKIEEG